LNDRPNVLLIVTDQERHRGWIPDDPQRQLPARARFLAEGMEFDRHYTHSSPCSPSRATLFCGQYLSEHGVTDNVFVDPAQTDLHHETPTIGHLLRKVGYHAGTCALLTGKAKNRSPCAGN
jgi:arylsulfatase